jgi:hypothetical protein
MLTKDEIIKWFDSFDGLKYPTSVYEELVVEQLQHPRKIEILGAWKTGCLRIDNSGKEYKDKYGITYSFTERWKPSAPVGYLTWIEISKIETEIQGEIPKEFPNEKPSIIVKMESQKGFGFIWSIFVLHCFYPENYPLFDQHVYRAYKYILSSENESPSNAPSSWPNYKKYCSFFKELVKSTGLQYYVVDRALWAYGKHIKQNSEVLSKHKPIVNPIDIDCNSGHIYSDLGDEWVHSTTFGGKAKSFWWKIDEECNIQISRFFNNKTGKPESKVISQRELNELDNYMQSDVFLPDYFVPLANNVEKLAKHQEKEGIGKFLFTHFNWSPTDCQLAGHLGVILSLSGAWEYNGKKRGIKFKSIIKCNLVNDYYHKSIIAEGD